MAVRDDAIAAGAEDYFPGEFATVDELAWEAVASFNAGGSQDQLDADIDNFENIYIAFIIKIASCTGAKKYNLFQLILGDRL